MTDDKVLLNTLKEINSITHKGRLGFKKKLELVLSAIIGCMGAKSGSILLMKGKSRFEVAASTKKELIGLRQRLEEGSPSEWVVKNKSLLYVDSMEKSPIFARRFDHYQGNAFLIAPLICNGKLMGIVNITDKIGADLFSREEQEALLDISGQVIGSIENHRLMESLKKKSRIINKKNNDLKKHEKLRTELFNMLIHDLKGPISDLTANLDILSYISTDENREYVELAREGSDNLYNMVSNLLDIVRLEEDKLKLVYERIDPRELIKESFTRLSGLKTISKIETIEQYPDNDLPYLFWGDRAILLRVLMNLVGNALNYSPEGESITVGFDLPRSSVMEFFVVDNGPGVPMEFRESIFEKYFQIEKKENGRIYTTGLGLTFCKMAVEAHGGKIKVESGNSGGSRFVFTIPVEIKKSLS
jgi:K+-sensing histidine kinase KdpD